MYPRMFSKPFYRSALLGLIALLLGAVGWQRYRDISRYKETQADREKPTATAVLHRHAIADVAFLKQLMPKSYGGYFDVSQQTWQKIFSGIDQDVMRLPDRQLPTAELAGILAKHFAAFEDGHLVIESHGQTRQTFATKPHLTPYLDAATSNDQCQKALLAKGFEPRPYFNRTTRRITLRPISLKATSPVLSSCMRPLPNGGADKTVAISPPKDNWQYIRLGSSYSKDYYKVLADAPSKISKNTHLIFDLRGHTGGDNRLDFRLVRSLGLPFTNPYSDGITHTTSAALQLQWNATKWGLEPINPKLAAERLIWLEQSLWQQFFGIGKKKDVVDYSHHDTAVTTKAMVKPFANHVVVFTDTDCMSACESLIKVLLGYRKTILVGTNTSGGVKIGDIAVVSLPNSKLRINLGRTYNPRFADSPRYREKTGFLPDIWLNTVGIKPPEAIAIARHLTDQRDKGALNEALAK